MPPDPFPVDFVTSSFGACNLKHYLDLIRGMSKNELAALRSKIMLHARSVRPQQAFSNTSGMTTHQALLKAVAHEKLRRSVLFPIWKIVIPFRKFVVSKFSGSDLENHEYFGAIYAHRSNSKTTLHLNHRALISNILRFLFRNWFSVASLVVGTAAVAVAWLKP